MKKTRKVKKLNESMIIFGIFLVFILLLFIQLIYLSVSKNVYGINMNEFAKSRNTVKTELKSKRGSIFDTSGDILAHDVSSYTVIAYLSPNRTGDSKTPLHVVDPLFTAEKLSPILEMEEADLEDLLLKDSYQVELGPGGRGISELKKTEIELLNLPGIDFIESSKRYYPNGDFSSYIIGYAKSNDDGDIIGEMGIELGFDDKLKGKNGYRTYQQDRNGYKIPDTPEEIIKPKNGNDLYLTTDSNIQRFLETAVKEANELYNPEWLLYYVMEAKTGKILAATSTPSFDPNIKEIENYQNPLTSVPFEPGSTMKTWTYLCAMEKGNYDGAKTLMSGQHKIGEDTIRDWNNYGWGEITFDQGLSLSSNVAIAKIMETFLTKEDLRDCFIKYGFGDITGIELPGEQVGDLDFNYPIEVATAAFGQGITTTPIQNLQALSLLANNGKMVKPHMIDKILSGDDGSILYKHRTEESEVLANQTNIDHLKNLMHDTIYGTHPGTAGVRYKVDSTEFIAKTGTAQIYNNETGGYLTGVNNYVFSIAGMYPKDNPEIIIYGALKRPTHGANSALVHVNKFVTDSIVKYRNMSIEEETETKVVTLDNYINKPLNDSVNNLNNLHLKSIVLGTGNIIISQYPKKGTTLLPGEKVFLITNEGDLLMPDIIGWTKKDVSSLAYINNIKFKSSGYGYVFETNIPKGTVLTKDLLLEVKLQVADKFKDKVS